MFRDRAEAGRQLAAALLPLRSQRPVVLGLPRGGVLVAAEVARALDAPLDVIVVRKLRFPHQPEVAMGALGEGGFRFLDEQVLQRAGTTQGALTDVERRERRELDRRVERYRRLRPRVPLRGRTVVIVDDGAATGSTARIACEAARAGGAARVVLAVPVAAPDAAESLRAVADDVVSLLLPRDFDAVGQYYRDFRPTPEEQVMALLAAADDRPDTGGPAA